MSARVLLKLFWIAVSVPLERSQRAIHAQLDQQFVPTPHAPHIFFDISHNTPHSPAAAAAPVRPACL